MANESCCSGCNRPDLPWAGRGTALPIAGCRFTLYPMTDRFIDIILGALEKTDTSAVWSETDALSTVYRGDAADPAEDTLRHIDAVLRQLPPRDVERVARIVDELASFGK